MLIAIAHLDKHSLTDDADSTADVAISASAANSSSGRDFTFFIRGVGRRVETEQPSVTLWQLPHPTQSLAMKNAIASINVSVY